MGSAFLFKQGSGPARAALLRAQMESLVPLERRFPQTVPVCKEVDVVLPFHGLPLGCVHEFQSTGLACGIAFSSLLIGRIPVTGGQMLYIAPDSSFHALGPLPYGVPPERWIHVVARNSPDLAWTVLEALRCREVSVVLAVVKAADLTLCRRWQLAAEGSGATCFLLTDSVAKPAIASVITRWRIDSIPAPVGAMFHEPCWNIDLSYCRGGRPAQWTVVWRQGRLAPSPSSKPLQRAELIAATKLAV